MDHFDLDDIGDLLDGFADLGWRGLIAFIVIVVLIALFIHYA